jgi:hypothetical protein
MNYIKISQSNYLKHILGMEFCCFSATQYGDYQASEDCSAYNDTK